MTVVEKATGNLLAGIGYSSADKFVFNASISQQNIFGTGNALIGGDQHELDQSHDLARRTPSPITPSTASRGRSRCISGTPILRRSRSSQYSVVDARRGGQLRRPDHRDRHRSTSGFRYEHTESAAVREQPAVYYILYVAQFGCGHRTAIVRQPAAGRVTLATTSSILRGDACRAAHRGGAAVGDLAYYKVELPASSGFWPIYGDLRSDAARRRRLCATGTAASRCRSTRRSTRAASVRCAATRRATLGPQDIFGNAIGRQAQDRRQRRVVLPDPQGRQVGAAERVRRCRPDLRVTARASPEPEQFELQSSAIRPASGSPGTRRSGRSSSATAFR